MAMIIKELLTGFNEHLTIFVVFPLIIIVGLYLSFRLKFVQLTKLRLGAECLFKKDQDCEGDISHFQAISAVLAGNFGTGNISGMAVAISTGGPGALVWMWIMAFLGSTIQYTSCVLGVKYRHRLSSGEHVGGPMYYLADGLGYRFLASAFCLFVIFGALIVGNLAQINSVILPLEKLGWDPLLCSFALVAFVGLVLVGGLQRVAKLASFIVPLKALLYMGAALVILALHVDRIIPACQIMFYSAFDFHSALGGVMGFGVLKALRSGFDRGIFATDAGTGIVPILQSGARTSSPILDGAVTLVAPFLVMIVCTTTGLVLLVTGAWLEPGLQSTNMVTHAFEQGLGSSIGSYIVIVALVLFAYTTILAWACCAEKAIDYLWGEKFSSKFKYLYIAIIPIGTLLHVDLIWILADIAISLMLIANLIGVIGLSKEVIQESNDYFAAPRPAISNAEVLT